MVLIDAGAERPSGYAGVCLLPSHVPEKDLHQRQKAVYDIQVGISSGSGGDASSGCRLSKSTNALPK